MAASLDPETRARIFELRGQDPPVSFERIAEMLGLTKGQVYREANRPATPAAGATNGAGASPAVAVAARRAAEEDPELAAALKRLQLKQLEVQDRELDRRLALMEGKSGGDGEMVRIVMEELRRTREEVDRRLGDLMLRPQSHSEDPFAGLGKGLGALIDFQQKLAVLAPAPVVPAGGGVADLEYRVAMEKIRIESDALTRQANSAAERNSFLLNLAKDNAPSILAGLQRFLERQSSPAPARAPSLKVIEGGESAATTAAVPAEVLMSCANCGARFMGTPEAGETGTCTQCGGPVQPDNGGPPPPSSGWPAEAQFT